jgi:hypothetical protein
MIVPTQRLLFRSATGGFRRQAVDSADRAVSERMGREARARVEALFSEKTMVDRYERLLLRLCGSAAPVHPDHPGRVNATH